MGISAPIGVLPPYLLQHTLFSSILLLNNWFNHISHSYSDITCSFFTLTCNIVWSEFSRYYINFKYRFIFQRPHCNIRVYLWRTGSRNHIVTQSIKKLKAEDKEWALNPDGFKRVSDGRHVDITTLPDDDTGLYYKEESNIASNTRTVAASARFESKAEMKTFVSITA